MLVLVKNWHSKRVHLELTLYVFDIKLCEWEYLWNLVVLKVLEFKQLATIFVDDVAELVDQVSLAVDLPTQLISEMTCFVLEGHDVTLLVSFKLANAVCYVKASTIIIEHFG